MEKEIFMYYFYVERQKLFKKTIKYNKNFDYKYDFIHPNSW